ncbi:hypothetical protein MMC10_004629 [Thelotrema lepadinum]|nr:hypothetical protein [Thelotrema lepadinum]
MADPIPNGHPPSAHPSLPPSLSISWPLHRPQNRTIYPDPSSPIPTDPIAANGHAHSAVPSPGYPPTTTPLDPSIQPTGPHSLSGISLRAFLLGLTFGLSTSLTLYTIFIAHSPLWRAPFFLAALALFHVLEFWVTAAYNTPLATTKAFLLTENGVSYNIAHGLALLETVLRHISPPTTTATSIPFLSRVSTFYASYLPSLSSPAVVVLGLSMMLLGQLTRSIAMAEAGTNFNHTVQWKKSRGHELVTSGIYGLLRHPSYFGFWWWGLGTQVVLGNTVCLGGYGVVLWGFFRARIEREEELLLKFFGAEYVRYKERTRVGIPFL